MKPPSKPVHTPDAAGATPVPQKSVASLDACKSKIKAAQPAVALQISADTSDSAPRDNRVRVIVFGSRLLPRQRKNNKKKPRETSLSVDVAPHVDTAVTVAPGLPQELSTPSAQTNTKDADENLEMGTGMVLDEAKASDSNFQAGEEFKNNNDFKDDHGSHNELEDENASSNDMHQTVDEGVFSEHVPTLMSNRKGMGGDLTDLFHDEFDIFR